MRSSLVNINLRENEFDIRSFGRASITECGTDVSRVSQFKAVPAGSKREPADTGEIAGQMAQIQCHGGSSPRSTNMRGTTMGCADPCITGDVPQLLESIAAKIENRGGNIIYKQAWKVAAKIVRSHKPAPIQTDGTSHQMAQP